MQNLNQIEKQVLYCKYVNFGFDSYEANGKVKDFCLFLKNLQIKLRKKKVPEEDINERFKKEFENLCQKLEAERYG